MGWRVHSVHILQSKLLLIVLISYSDIHWVHFHSLLPRRYSIPIQNFMYHWTFSSLFWFRMLSSFVNTGSCWKWSTHKKVETNKFELANNFLNKKWCCDISKTFWWYTSQFQKLKFNQIWCRRYTVLLQLQRLSLPRLGKLHQKRKRPTLQLCNVKACTIFHWNLTLLT
jgi:hypothetical protein